MTVLEPASTNSTRFQQIFARLKRGKKYREHFVESEISVGIPLQIKGMREMREWTQKELGSRSGKHQSVISQLENPGYGKLTLTTLKTLAAAFDVGLMVRFVPFSELAGRASNLSASDMEIPSFDEDPGLEQKISSGSSASVLATQSSNSRSSLFESTDRKGPNRAMTLTTNTSDGNRYGRVEDKQSA